MVSPSTKLVLNSFQLFANTMFLHFYEESVGLNNELCTSLANDLYKKCKAQKSTHGKALAVQEALVTYTCSVIERSELNQIDRDFILKCITHSKFQYGSFLAGFIHKAVSSVTTKPDWNYRRVVDTFASYIYNLANQDIENFSDEVAKVLMRESEEVARYTLLKFAES